MTTRRGARSARCATPATTSSTSHADDVLIDLLTDSGTGAMSRDQWAGDPARRRELRRLAVVVPRSSRPSRSCSRSAHVIPTHQGRAAEKILFTVIGGPGKVDPEQHPLRHHPRQRRVHRRGGGRPRHPGGPRPAPRSTRSRATWTSTRSTRCCASAARRHPGRVRDRHQQLRRRPAGLAGEPARRCGRVCDRARRAAVPRRLPLRRERLVHPRARAGPGGPRRARTSCARWPRSPTA